MHEDGMYRIRTVAVVGAMSAHFCRCFSKMLTLVE